MQAPLLQSGGSCDGWCRREGLGTVTVGRMTLLSHVSECHVAFAAEGTEPNNGKRQRAQMQMVERDKGHRAQQWKGTEGTEANSGKGQRAAWGGLSAIPRKSKVACLVVVGEVAKASHPDVAGNEHPDCIVHFFGLKIVVQQKEHLHTDRQTDTPQHMGSRAKAGG